MQDAKKVENFEVKSLETAFSEKILVSKVVASVNAHQKDQLIDISKGIPLLLKGLADILRQERKSAADLIAGVQKSKVDAKEKPLNFEEEGVDVGQLSTIREMFDTLLCQFRCSVVRSLTSQQLKFSASVCQRL